MVYEEENHFQKHQRRVEDVQIVFMAKQVPIVAHEILNDSEDGPYHDEARAAVEGIEHLFPGRAMACRISIAVLEEAMVPQASDYNEEAEEQDLCEEPGDDDLLANIHRLQSTSGLNSSTTHL